MQKKLTYGEKSCIQDSKPHTNFLEKNFNCSIFTSNDCSIFVLSCIFILLSRESDQSAITSYFKLKELPVICPPHQDETTRKVLFPTAQVNLPAYSPCCFFNTERQVRKLVYPESESNPSLHLQRRTLLPLGHLSLDNRYISSVTTTTINYNCYCHKLITSDRVKQNSKCRVGRILHNFNFSALFSTFITSFNIIKIFRDTKLFINLFLINRKLSLYPRLQRKQIVCPTIGSFFRSRRIVPCNKTLNKTMSI